jgi:hypothetical protein
MFIIYELLLWIRQKVGQSKKKESVDVVIFFFFLICLSRTAQSESCARQSGIVGWYVPVLYMYFNIPWRECVQTKCTSKKKQWDEWMNVMNEQNAFIAFKATLPFSYEMEIGDWSSSTFFVSEI